MRDAVFQPRGFGQIGPRAFDDNLALAQNRQQRPRSGRRLEFVGSRQLRRAIRQAAVVVGSRRCPAVSVESVKPGPGRIAKTDGSADVPQDRDDIGRFIFGCFDNHEALSGKDKAAVGAKDSVANPESQPRACQTRRSENRTTPMGPPPREERPRSRPARRPRAPWPPRMPPAHEVRVRRGNDFSSPSDAR